MRIPRLRGACVALAWFVLGALAFGGALALGFVTAAAGFNPLASSERDEFGQAIAPVENVAEGERVVFDGDGNPVDSTMRDAVNIVAPSAPRGVIHGAEMAWGDVVYRPYGHVLFDGHVYVGERTIKRSYLLLWNQTAALRDEVNRLHGDVAELREAIGVLLEERR